MSPLVEVQLIAWRELRKSVRSLKGLVLAAMALAGGAGASMLFAWIDRLKREALPKIAASTMSDWWLRGNARPVRGAGELEQVLEQAW